jgi:hypothetical protein
MFLDRCVITTWFEVTPEVFADRPGFNARKGTDILDIEPGSKQLNGKDVKTAKLVFGSYGGIVVFADQQPSGRWFAHNIHFNPRNVMYRHNGNGLSVKETLNALTFLRDQVFHILADLDDFIHIVPGLHPHSCAFWSVLEILVDLADPDGVLQNRVFRNPRFPKMAEGFRYRDGTVQIGAPGGPFTIKFYRKDKQLSRVLRKYGVEDAPRVFRVEITLSQYKLLEHLGHDRNVGIIDGYKRLIRFSPVDLIDFYQQAVRKLRGCFNVAAADGNAASKDKLGRFMALVATQFDIPLDDLFDLYEGQIGCAGKTSGRHRAAASEMLASISPVALDQVFSDRHYQYQPAIVIRELEREVQSRRLEVVCDDDIWQVYGRPLPFPRPTPQTPPNPPTA